jgi:hypothetical protein
MKSKKSFLAAAAAMLMFTPAPAFATNANVDWCQRGFNPTAYSGYMWIPCLAHAIVNHPW